MINLIQAIKSGNSKIVSKCIAGNVINEIDDKDEYHRFPIHIACDLGHTEIAQLLIENQFDLEVQDILGCTPLHLASNRGEVDIVLRLIENLGNIEALDNSRMTPLHYASRKGHAGVVKLLIGNKCNLEEETHMKRRAIHIGCYHGHLEVVKLLIDSKCEIDAKDDLNWRPIHSAGYNGHLEIVKLLLDNGCVINEKDKIWCSLEDNGLNFMATLIEERPDMFQYVSEKDDLLIYACEKGRTNTVHIFCDKKHDFNVMNDCDQIPLHCACANGHLAVVRLLLENECSTELANDNGKLAIHCAAANGHIDIVKCLIGSGCDPNVFDKGGKRAMHWALENDRGEMIKYFIMNESDEEQRQKEMRMLMEEACSNNYINVIRTLIENHLDLQTKYKEGCNAIHIACDHGHVNVVRLLLDSGCDLEAEDDYHWRPIHSACYGGSTEVVKLLLDRGCQIDSNDWLDMRPLHLATTFGHPEVVNMLYLNGCTLDPVDMYDRTPLQIAILEKEEQCEEVLNEAFQTRRTLLEMKIGDISDYSDEMLQTIFLVDSDTRRTLLDIVDEERPEIMETVSNAPIEENDILSWTRISPSRMAPKSYRLLQECLLYRSIVHNYSIGFQMLCTPDLVNRARLLKGESVLHLVIRYGNGMFVERVLRIMMTLDDVETEERYQVPHEWSIIPIISARKEYVKLKERAGYNRLHIAVFDNESVMVDYIMQHKLVDPDNGANAVGTALSLSYTLGHTKCRDVLQRYKVKSNTIDRFGRSPLVIALESHLYEDCDYLVDNLDPSPLIDNMGLTVLDRAVIAGREELCRKLLSKGYICTQPISIIRHLSIFDPDIKMVVPTKTLFKVTMDESSMTLCPKIHGSVFQCMLDSLDNHTISVCDGDSNTLLHLCASLLQPDVCRQLINKGIDCGALDNHGDTAMLKMLKYNMSRRYNDIKISMIRITRMLVGKCGDVDKPNTSGESILEVAIFYKDEELLLAIVSSCLKLEHVKLNFISQCSRMNFSTFLSRILPLVAQEVLDKLVDINVTNICINCKLVSKSYKLFNNLRKEEREKVVENLILLSALKSQEKAFDSLIKNAIPNITILSNGETVLTSLILQKKTTFCRRIIDSQNGYRFVNTRNRRGISPLRLVIEADMNELIEGVIFHVEDVNDPDGDGETALSRLCSKLSTDSTKILSRLKPKKDEILSQIKTLILFSGDIHRPGPNGQSAIDRCLDSDLKSAIELFFLQNTQRNERKKQQA